MRKVIAILMLGASFLFASINLQTATKEELMSIKGIGEKKAEAIIKYRKTNKINSADDLKNIKGFGNSIVTNVKKNKTVAKAEKSKKDMKKELKKVDDKKQKASKELNKTKKIDSKKDELIKTKK
jgi:competence protein ComEA